MSTRVYEDWEDPDAYPPDDGKRDEPDELDLYAADVRRLRAQVRELERERDEARAQLAELKRGLTPNNDDFQLAFLDHYLDHFRTLRRERDEARLILAKWDKDYEGVCEDRERALALLRECEWAGDGDAADNSGCCLFCLAHNGDGHAPGCRLDEVLKNK